MFARAARSAYVVLSLVLLLWLACTGFAIQAQAQIGNANLGGTVTDQSGAVVEGAELTLTNKANNFQAKTTCNERGEYTFRNLNPGTYDLTVTKTGYQTYVQTGLVITINASAHADAVLHVGAVNETVTVSGENTLINYDNGTVQGGADPQTLNNLPLVVEGKPRSSAALAVLLPGVSTGSSSEAFQARINGGLESGDEALLDGATMQEGFMSQSGMVSIQQDFQMSPDMVQEVKVLTSSYDPQYGSSTGGQITMVTKSGTNQFHGAAFLYNRNAAFNANSWNNNFSGLPKPPDNENNGGASIGGPVKIPGVSGGRRRTFFYFDWETYRQAGGSSVSTLSVPSALERTGNFTDWKDSSGNIIPIYVPATITPACQAALPAGVGPGKQFPGNIIPSGCISPITAAYLSYVPQPNVAGNPTINNYNLPRPVPDNLTGNSNVYLFRIDHYLGEKDHFYFFWWRQFAGFLTQTALPRAIAYESPAHPENAPISRLNWEHTFSPTMTNHATFGYLNRNEGYSSENLSYIGKLPQIPGAPGTNALPAFQFNGCSGACAGGFASYSNSNGPGGTNVTVRPTWVFNDMVSKVIGHHTLTFGGEWRNVQGNIHATGNQSGTYNFQVDTTSLAGINSGSPIAGFLLGAVSGGSVDRRTVSAWYPRQWVYALHANDTWKITPKLTFNYGLRWDYYSPSREKYNRMSFIDLAGMNPEAGIPGRLAFAGSQYGGASYGAQFPETPWKKGFAPRLGVAYAINDKTVVRAGYGIFFAQAFYPGWGGGMSLDGFNLHQSFATSPTASGAVNPAFYLDQGVPVPAQAPPIINSSYDNGHLPLQANGNGSAYRPVDGNRRPYAQQWNLTIERQLPHEVFLSVATVGSKGTRLPSSLNPANALNPFAANVQALMAPSSSHPGQPELEDVFKAGDTTLDGVNIPYPTWVSDLTGPTSACAPTVAQALQRFPQFCGNLQGLDENHGNSIYNSFQLKLEKRYSHGLYGIVSYTNSKLISNASDNTQQNAQLGVQQGVVSPFQQSRARSLSSDDVPQTLSMAFVYDAPFGRGQRFSSGSGILNTVIGGWQLSPIIHYSTGTPMWFRSSTCQVVPQFRQHCLVGQVPGLSPFLQDPNHYNPAKGPLLNSAAFEPLSDFQFTNTSGVLGPGQFGFSGTGPRISNLRGPNYKNVDFSITKNTRIRERLNFQLRFAFFNAFNMHQFTLNNPNNINNQGSNFAFNNDISAPNFGGWNGNVSSPRTIQIAGRLEF